VQELRNSLRFAHAFGYEWNRRRVIRTLASHAVAERECSKQFVETSATDMHDLVVTRSANATHQFCYCLGGA